MCVAFLWCGCFAPTPRDREATRRRRGPARGPWGRVPGVRALFLLRAAAEVVAEIAFEVDEEPAILEAQLCVLVALERVVVATRDDRLEREARDGLQDDIRTPCGQRALVDHDCS